jgi:hypothetical protein
VRHRGVTAHDHQDRGTGQAGLGPGVHLVEQAGCEASLRRGPSRLPPDPTGEVGDRGALPGVANDDEDPRLQVLGARGVGGGGQAPLDQGVVDRATVELPARPLAQGHVEEGGRVARVARVVGHLHGPSMPGPPGDGPGTLGPPPARRWAGE